MQNWKYRGAKPLFNRYTDKKICKESQAPPRMQLICKTKAQCSCSTLRTKPQPSRPASSTLNSRVRLRLNINPLSWTLTSAVTLNSRYNHRLRHKSRTSVMAWSARYSKNRRRDRVARWTTVRLTHPT